MPYFVFHIMFGPISGAMLPVYLSMSISNAPKPVLFSLNRT
jgi:hypothetical protein